MNAQDHPRGRVGEPPATGAAGVDAEPDAESVARAIALRLLNHSPRSRTQPAEAMARKDVPEEVADRVLDRFTEVGLIDDWQYAQMLVRTRQSERGLARRALADELRRKGIGTEEAEAALATVEPEDEGGAAGELLARKAAAFAGLGLVGEWPYAQRLARTRQSERGLARRALADELRRKGIGTEEAEAALATVQPEDEERAARELLARKAPASAGLDPVKRRRRLVSMLGRKGYPPGLSYRLVSEVLDDDGDGPFDDADEAPGLQSP